MIDNPENLNLFGKALSGDQEALDQLASNSDLLETAKAFITGYPDMDPKETILRAMREVLDGFVNGEYTQAFLEEMAVDETDFLEKGAGNLLIEGLKNPKFVKFLKKKFLGEKEKEPEMPPGAKSTEEDVGIPEISMDSFKIETTSPPIREEQPVENDLMLVFNALVTEKMRQRLAEQLHSSGTQNTVPNDDSVPVHSDHPQASEWSGFKKIVLVMEKGVNYEDMRDAREWFNQFGNEIKAELRPDEFDLQKDSSGRLGMTDGSTFRRLQSIRRQFALGDDSLLLLLTASPNEGNWFLVNDPQSPENAFFHLDNYGWATPSPTKIVTAHFMMKAIFNANLQKNGVDYLDASHQKARGCFFDFCADKTQLNLKMRTADICGDCMQTLQEAKVPDNLLRQAVHMLEDARRTAVNTSIFMKKEKRSESRFQMWPFPVAITRHKALAQREPRARFSALEQHWLALVRYSFLANEVMAGSKPTIGDEDNYYKPSLGWWEKQLSNASDGGAKRALGQAHGFSTSAGIVKMRNDFKMGQPEHEIIKLIPRMEEGIQKMEDCLESFLTESHRLFFIEDMDLDPSAFSISGQELIGSHLIPPHFDDKLSTDAIHDFKGKKKVYLFNQASKKLFDFSEFALRRKCPKCQIEDRLMMIESIPHGKRKYQDVYLNCRVHL